MLSPETVKAFLKLSLTLLTLTLLTFRVLILDVCLVLLGLDSSWAIVAGTSQDLICTGSPLCSLVAGEFNL